MARPKKENHPISIRMNKAIYDRLNEFCEVSGQPKTVAIERALEVYINSFPATAKQTIVFATNDKQENKEKC